MDMIRADYHMHTSFSDDSQSSPEEMVQGAIARGLRTICITDHYDIDYPHDPSMFRFDVETYYETILALKEKYRSQIEVLVGIELGMQPYLGEQYRALVKRVPFDFVIGSVHVVGGLDPYYPAFFDGKTDEEGYRETFEETLEDLRNTEDFDVVGHIDYVVRYGREKAVQYSYKKFAEPIDEILKYVIDHGKGIEMNTAGFKYGLGFAHPHPDVIRRYRELGGEIITVGADGHKPEHIAYDFQRVSEILKACGFQYYTEFRSRKPEFRRLP